ncbi:winged helix-turn-helix transcriptional regulator [Methanolobus sediminis]|uniref:Winged helix-turn-helix transcriptional regulator n=1 Tax=Methanolobus sediminis TaxID=3072978 RepID=A0AA51UKV9_9EURY|nr:winged helix-turn-helix transcriptional regulator [Methanolobus sediminis]WMW25260.1 winged helix-turn-helix transcriptional regulator [Methanolobus sediminis]
MIKEKTKLMISAGILILAGIITVSTLLQDAPVVIQIDGESFKIIEIPYSYTTGEAYLLLISGFFSGFTLYQIFLSLDIYPFKHKTIREFSSDIEVKTNLEMLSSGNETEILAENQASIHTDMKKILLMALEGDEKKIVRTIVDNNGQILQNELVNRLDFSKAKTSRVLSNLEKKGIISKQKYGLTNCISLTEEIRGENK